MGEQEPWRILVCDKCGHIEHVAAYRHAHDCDGATDWVEVCPLERARVAEEVFVDANSKIAGLRAERDEARVELERGVRAFNRHGDSSLWKIKADDLHRSLQALREGVRGVVNWLAVDDAAEDSEAVIRRLDALLDTAPEEEGS